MVGQFVNILTMGLRTLSNHVNILAVGLPGILLQNKVLFLTILHNLPEVVASGIF